MKNRGVILGSLLILSMGISKCDLLRPDTRHNDVEDAIGTTEVFGERIGQFVIRPDSDPGIAYMPISDLPTEFRASGLRVIFSGNIVPFPEDPPFDASYPLFEVVEIRFE